MFHIGRSGSTVLAGLLRQHPSIDWAGEIFEHMPPAYYRARPARRAREAIANTLYERATPIVGFEVKYLPEQHLNPGLADCTVPEAVALVRELGVTHHLVLERRNLLRQVISTEIGHQTQTWFTSEAPKGPTRIRLDPDRVTSYGLQRSLTAYFDAVRASTSELLAALEGLPVLRLTYEDDVEGDPTVGYERICGFLGVEAEPAAPTLQRMNPYPLADLVENLGDIEARLVGTDDSWMTQG